MLNLFSCPSSFGEVTQYNIAIDCITTNNEVGLVCQRIFLYKNYMELIGVRLPEELKKKLQQVADSQHRPLSNLIRLILIEWVEEYDKQTKKKQCLHIRP